MARAIGWRILVTLALGAFLVAIAVALSTTTVSTLLPLPGLPRLDYVLLRLPKISGDRRRRLVSIVIPSGPSRMRTTRQSHHWHTPEARA